MAAPRLEAYRVVWLSFNADPDVKHPYLPADSEDLVGQFLRWLLDESKAGRPLVPPVRSGMCGGGMWQGLLFDKEAARAIEWWRAHGVEAVEYAGWETK